MDLTAKRVTVMGLGRFGGGVGVARYLVKQGADVLVTDTLPAEQLKESLAQLDGLPIEYRLGEHNVSDFTTCDLVIANPAVKPDNRFLRAAEAAGIPITSEIRLLVQALPNRLRTIGVTGTAGKSTTTAMIGHVLKDVLAKAPKRGRTGRDPSDRIGWGNFAVGGYTVFPVPQDEDLGPEGELDKVCVWVGGNIGGSLLSSIDNIDRHDWVVLELSSFMLEGLRKDGWSPHIAVITNLSPNHLDWHGSFDRYVKAKCGIFANQQDKDRLLTLENVKHTCDELSKTSDVECLPVSAVCMTDQLQVDESEWFTRLPGVHNQTNAIIALQVVEEALLRFYPAHKDWRAIEELKRTSIKQFGGLPHRLQFVLEHNGVRFFNDSKCTTPEAAELAIRSFEPGTVHIILGGYDKGSDLTPLVRFAAERCGGIYTIGVTGDVIATAAEAASAVGEVVRCETLDVAVREAVKRAKPGQIVLLSPACASWDQFDNYERRGERFIELVKQVIG